MTLSLRVIPIKLWDHISIHKYKFVEKSIHEAYLFISKINIKKK